MPTFTRDPIRRDPANSLQIQMKSQSHLTVQFFPLPRCRSDSRGVFGKDAAALPAHPSLLKGSPHGFVFFSDNSNTHTPIAWVGTLTLGSQAEESFYYCLPFESDYQQDDGD